MEIDIRKDQIKERKADSQGRINLPSTKYGDKIVEFVVTGTRDPDESDWTRRPERESGARIYVWQHTDQDEEVRVIQEEPGYYIIQAVRGGHEKYDIGKTESPGDAYEKAENWMEKNLPESSL